METRERLNTLRSMDPHNQRTGEHHKALMVVLETMASDIARLRAEVEILKRCGQSYGKECIVCTRPRGHSGEHGGIAKE